MEQPRRRHDLVPDDAEQDAWLVHRFAHVEKMTSFDDRHTIPAHVPRSVTRLPTDYPGFLHNRKLTGKPQSEGFSCRALRPLPTGLNLPNRMTLPSRPLVCRQTGD